ncbi:MAG: DNA mismatch repair endonuclease MutL [Clostridiales Family XIII bacterium]|jgi:DNA mismatch repair protein MutL|nr:DNA mismatch repair endonuclease MutL [Clostridiales Family XIII bacterium]
MPNRIRQLPRQVYDLIAAGEVVTSPLSVVKELVENAIDAGADRVVVEIEEGGIARIRVSDNGTGIAEADLPLAFAAHATSKIEAADDLSRIGTLGFRGEALASIAAVSKVTMVTRAAESAAGARVSVQGGEAEGAVPVGAERGTSVTVESLFFNIPARLAQLNSPRGEAAKIVDFCSRMAVCYVDIAFRLVSNGAVLFATRGAGDRFAAITTVYGTGVAAALVPVSASGGDLTLTGFISDPTGLRKTRRGQVLFVNGRSVRSAAVDSAIDRAYKEFAEPGRFPVTFLFLDVDPGRVDVNIHPAKSEIAFHDAGGVADFVEGAVRETLVSERSIPRLRMPGRRAQDGTFALKRDGGQGAAAAKDPIATEPDMQEDNGGIIHEVDVKELLSSISRGDYAAFPDAVPEGAAGDPLPGVAREDVFAYADGAGYPADSGFGGFACGPDAPPALAIDRLQVLAQLFATYLLAAGGESFYIIDQHAAHERVNYEKFLRGARAAAPPKQQLLTPHLFTVPAQGLADFGALIPQLARLGYEIEEFGDDTYAARTFPAFLRHEEAAAFLVELLDETDRYSVKKPGMADSAAVLERLILRACKSSVKANAQLTEPEIAGLLADLEACENPYTCPHGRPVFLKLTKQDIERLFKRA